MEQELLLKLFLIIILWILFKRSKSISMKPFIRWRLDPSKHNHPVTPVRIPTDAMFTLTLYIPVLLISTTELVCQHYSFTYSSMYAIGFLASGILTSVIKMIISRPRPNAIQYEEIARNNCDNKKKDTKIHVARQSFLSAHAFAGLFASTFTTMFIMEVLPSFPVILLLIVLVAGLYPGLTQAIDRWHHESDVLAGYTFGLATALISFRYV